MGGIFLTLILPTIFFNTFFPPINVPSRRTDYIDKINGLKRPGQYPIRFACYIHCYSDNIIFNFKFARKIRVGGGNRTSSANLIGYSYKNVKSKRKRNHKQGTRFLKCKNILRFLNGNRWGGFVFNCFTFKHIVIGFESRYLTF